MGVNTIVPITQNPMYAFNSSEGDGLNTGMDPYYSQSSTDALESSGMFHVNGVLLANNQFYTPDTRDMYGTASTPVNPLPVANTIPMEMNILYNSSGDDGDSENRYYSHAK